jgi:hypothetical protein
MTNNLFEVIGKDHLKRREVIVKVLACTKLQEFDYTFININPKTKGTMLYLEKFTATLQGFTMFDFRNTSGSFTVLNNPLKQITCGF